MPAITGQRRTDNIAAFQRPVDMADPILNPEYEPAESPLLVFTKQIYNGGRRTAAIDPLFNWAEYPADVHIDAINNVGGYATGATSLVVDTGDLFYAGCTFIVPRTGEIIRVTGVATNTLTVVRAQGGTTAAAILDDDPLFIMGFAAEEGDMAPAARTRNPVKKTNYTEIFRDSVQESGSERSSANETSPHDWDFQVANKAREHKVNIEKAFWFGGASEITGPNGGKIRYTGGAFSFITQNRMDAGQAPGTAGQLVEDEVETFLRTNMRFGSKKKVWFVSPLVLSVLNKFSSSKIQTAVADTVYGVQVMRWLSAHGEVALVKNDLFQGPYAGYAALIDFNKGSVAYRYLGAPGAPGESRDTKLHENIQENARDGRMDEYLTECGLQLGPPEVHGLMFGVTTA